MPKFYLLYVVTLAVLLFESQAAAQAAADVLVEAPCSANVRDEIENHFSTKTPYRVVANMDDSRLEYPGCRASRIWSVVRHGTRNPSKEVIESAQDDLMALKQRILDNPRSGMCAAELERLRYWRFNVSAEEEKFLVPEGEDELVELAERMQRRLPELLPEMYDPHLFYFKYTATQRTLKSAQSFATGLFGRQRLGEIVYPKAMHKDPVLRFYKLCKRWKIDVDKNPRTFENVRQFLQGPEIDDSIQFIKRKTQLKDITAADAQLIYTICAFETAWQPRSPASIWCSLFNRNTIQALEFAEDLEYYWNDGYGYDLTPRIACPAVADMFAYLDPASAKPNATFYFTHSGTVLKLLAHLGLYKDAAPLTHADFQRQRSWRTSAIDAFASNIAFVLYECEKSEPMVLTLHQERPVRIPGCPLDSELCSLRELRRIYAESVEACDFQAICHR